MECRRVHARLLLLLQSATRPQQQGQVSDSCDHHIHLHHYHHVLPTQKDKCSNRTHKIFIIIVHINLFTLIVNLMKIRNSITKRNTLVKERNPYWILSSKLLSPPLLSAGNHIEDRWNTTLNRHQRHYHHQPYPTSRCSGHLSESYALLRCSTSWSSFWYCGCFFNSSSSTPRWHSHRYPRCYWSNLSSPPVNNPRDLPFTHQTFVPTSSSNITLSNCCRPTFCQS